MLFNESPASSFSMSASRISLDLTPCLPRSASYAFPSRLTSQALSGYSTSRAGVISASLTVSILRWESRSKVLMVSISSPQNSIR